MARLNQKLSIFEGEEKKISGTRVHREFETILDEVDGNGRRFAYKEAIRHGDKSMTFGEVNTEANLIARIIKQRIDSENVQGFNNVVFGIYINPSIERLIAILAVVKLGATFLPLNPNLPDNRIKCMLDISKATGLIALNKDHVDHLESVLVDKTCKVIDYNALRCKAVQLGISRDNLEHSEEFPGDKSSSATLSIVFTSGTTGKPKGVPITHRGVLNITTWQENEFSMGSEERNAHHVNCLAVSFNCEIFGSLLRGKPLVVISEETRANPDEFIRALESNKINRVMGCPPTLAQNMFLILKDQGQTERLQSLKALQAGGETVSPGVVYDFLALHNFNDAIMINGYGLSETTMLCLVGSFKSRQDTLEKIRDGKVAIGSPIPNNNVYILNDQMEPVRHGQVGQICVSGAHVSPGYLSNESNSNSDVFRPNHILQQPGHEILFCTGDYGAIRNGAVYYEGRNQNHFKIRGYRVSTIEVEETIMQVAGVKRAAAFGHGESDTDTIMVAYYTCLPGERVSPEEILAHCQRELPEHSIPQLYMLKEMPLRPPVYKVDYPALRLLFERKNENADDALPRSFNPKTVFIFKNVKEMSENEKKLAVKLVADSYLGADSEIIKNLGLTRNLFEAYTALAIPLAVKDAMSFCVIETSSNKMVALALTLHESVKNVEITDAMSDKDAALSQFLLDLEGPFIKEDEHLPGKTAWATRFGVDPTLPQEQILQITTMCIEESIKRAKENGFARLQLTTPHRSIQEIMFRHGAKIHNQIHMSTYESGGFRPYPDVPAGVFIMSMVLDLNSEKICSKPSALTLKELVDIISDILLIPPQDIDAKKNLFEIGANSINAVRIWAGLKDMGYSSRFEDFLAAPTIEEILYLEKQEVGCHTQNWRPSTTCQEDAIAVIAEVLSLSNEEVYRNKDKSFFEMGGNSGNAARAWSSLKALGHHSTFEEFISAISINDIITTSSQEHGSDTDSSDDFPIVPFRDLNEKSIDRTLECIVDSYCVNKNEILKVLHNFSDDKFHCWVDQAWVQAKQDGMSFAIRKKLSDEIVAGGFLTTKNRLTAEGSETIYKNIGAHVMGIIQAGEGLFLKLEPSLPGKTLWASCFGIRPDMRGRQVMEIMCIAINHSIRVARQGGFKRLYAFTANPTFQTLLMERGARVYTRLQIAAFEHDGRKPFGDAPPDAYNMAIVLEL